MKKDANKKNKNIHQIFGLNGSLNLLEYYKKKIKRVDIMSGGVAERKIPKQQLQKTVFFPIFRLSKDQFLKHYKYNL